MISKFKNKWSDEHTQFLKDNYGKMTIAKIAKVVDRSDFAVSEKARALGIRKAVNHWSAEDIKWLRENYHTADMAEMEKRLNRSPQYISNKAWQLKLTGKRYSVNNHMAGRGKLKTNEVIRRSWSDEDIEFLKANYATMFNKKIAERIEYRHTPDAISRMAGELGLTNVKTTRKVKNRKAATPRIKAVRKPVEKKQKVEKIRVINPRRKAMEHRIPTIVFTTEGKQAIRIDHKTIIYVNASASESEIDRIKQRYRKAS